MIIHTKIIQVKTEKKTGVHKMYYYKIFYDVPTFIRLYGFSHIDLVLELKISKRHGS